MGTKLSTSGADYVTVQVCGEKGQYFIGTFTNHETFDGRYKNEDGTNKKRHMFEFSVEDTNMRLEKKQGEQYVEANVSAGDTVAMFTPTRLTNALLRATVGQRLRIEYLGLGKTTKFGGKPHEYDVEVL